MILFPALNRLLKIAPDVTAVTMLDMEEETLLINSLARLVTALIPSTILFRILFPASSRLVASAPPPVIRATNEFMAAVTVFTIASLIAVNFELIPLIRP